MPKPSQTLASCHERTAAPEWFRRCHMKLFGNQRFDLEDLRCQRLAVGATQVGVTDLAPGLEGLAVVVQMAVGNRDDLLDWRAQRR